MTTMVGAEIDKIYQVLRTNKGTPVSVGNIARLAKVANRDNVAKRVSDLRAEGKKIKTLKSKTGKTQYQLA